MKHPDWPVEAIVDGRGWCSRRLVDALNSMDNILVHGDLFYAAFGVLVQRVQEGKVVV